MEGLPAGVDPHFGGFEQHSRGIGSHLLRKWGWGGAGGGLGRTGDGITEPIMPLIKNDRLGVDFSFRDRRGRGSESSSEEEEEEDRHHRRTYSNDSPRKRK